MGKDFFQFCMKHAFLKNQFNRRRSFFSILKYFLLSNLVFSFCSWFIYSEGSRGLFIFAQSSSDALGTAEARWLQVEINGADFWNKLAIQKQIFVDRKIVVSTVHREKSQEKYWSFKGAGAVQADFSEAVLRLRDFSKLPEVSDHFESADWNPDKSSLNVKIKFMGKVYQIPFVIREEKSDKDYQLFFSSHQHDYFKGIEGRIYIQKGEATEKSLLMSFKAVSLRMPSYLPDLVVQVASEAVMHHVADLLRKYLEKAKN